MNEELQQQLIKDMLVESFDGLDLFDRELLGMEKGAASADTLNKIFRAIHTIKGTAGCLGLNKIQSVAHVGENLLSSIRDGKIVATPEMINTLLEFSDALKSILRNLESEGNEGTKDFSQLLKQLQDLQSGKSSATSSVAPTVSAPAAPEPSSAAPAPAPAPVDNGWGLFEDEAPQAAPAPTTPTQPAPAPSAPAPSPAIASKAEAFKAAAAAAAKNWGLFADEPDPAAVPPTASKPSVTAAAQPLESKSAQGTSVSDSSIRVDVNLLDKLMNLVGELVLARNQIVQFSLKNADAGLIKVSQRLNTVTTELQESVMKTRMQPIGNVWAKFPRIVRDVATDLGKKVNLTMEGNDTELDRTIIESIKDPLTHIIRNAIDHGIEKPEVRKAAQKNPEGSLMIRAFHEGGQVNIEVIDDGAGINVARVRQKAVEKGLIDNAQAAKLTEREVFNLLFLPGFSTAEKVTNVSGRGVGMDVVKTNIEKIGGSVDIQSEPGWGTTLKIKIPLTLAIIPALITTSAGENFAIPQVSLLELVRLDGKEQISKIELLYGQPVYRLRGQLLPLIDLNQQLKLTEPQPLQSREMVNIVILQSDGKQFGLIVDDINDSEEIVVKPLGKQLKGIGCFAGATIMGDGRVALILDVHSLAIQSGVISQGVIETAIKNETRAAVLVQETESLLIFTAGKDSRMAIPLSLVARLEEISQGAIEYSGTQEVIQYRGGILPLIRVSRLLPTGGTEPANSTEPLHVVVYSDQGRSVGLVVGKINDIVQESLSIKRESNTPGVAGSAVICNRITDLLDIRGIINAANANPTAQFAATSAAKTILS